MDRLLLYRIPAGASLEDRMPGGTILASHVPVYGLGDAGGGLWICLKDTCQASGFFFFESNLADTVHIAK